MERDWKIGEIRQINGEWYQCVKGDICADCAFVKKNCNDNPLFKAIGSCCYYRKDATSVIFKKLEKVGEPFVGKVHFQLQRYKIYTEPIIDPAENVGYVNEGNTIAIEIKENKEDNNGMTNDEVEILQQNTSDIDWEQIRIKAAISALQGFASNPHSTTATDKELAEWSVSCANNLIAELKKGGEK